MASGVRRPGSWTRRVGRPIRGRCGDAYDRDAFQTLARHGAVFPVGAFGAESDAAVVAETLRVAPPRWSRTATASEVEAEQMAGILLRRRSRAAYVAFAERMQSSDPELRAGAANDFAHLDARDGGGPAAIPPASGAERETAIALVESLLLSDPDPCPRQAASYAFLWQLADPLRPTTIALEDALMRETDETVKGNLISMLAARQVSPP